MNEKIQELFEQVADNLDPEDCMVSEEFLEAFTELIVRECMSQIESKKENCGPSLLDGLDFAVETIQEHFGVKE